MPQVDQSEWAPLSPIGARPAAEILGAAAARCWDFARAPMLRADWEEADPWILAAMTLERAQMRVLAEAPMCPVREKDNIFWWLK